MVKFISCVLLTLNYTHNDHKHTHTYTHTHSLTCIRSHRNSYAHTQPSCMHACTCLHTHPCTCIQKVACTHTTWTMHAYMCTHTQAHTHTHTHMLVHTHKHTHSLFTGRNLKFGWPQDCHCHLPPCRWCQIFHHRDVQPAQIIEQRWAVDSPA